MDAFVIQGGHRLSGEVTVSGSKNAALPMMACSLLSDQTITLRNVPNLVDVATLSDVLTSLGCCISHHQDVCKIAVKEEANSDAPYDLVRKMRASVCVLGPLLAKRGFARVSLPGGCNIGHRPIDLHLKGLQALGADIQLANGYVEATAKSLRGAQIDLAGANGSTVTGTCNVMSAATLARGATVITSAAREPEVVAVAELLNSMGANILGHGTSTICIEGIESLHGTEATVIPDRIEAATLMIAAVMTQGDVTIHELQVDHLSAVFDVLKDIGVDVIVRGADRVHVNSETALKPIRFSALPYPGIPTDVQAQLMSCLTTVSGRSIVTDAVFPDRFMHCAELNRMGADIQQRDNNATIRGVSRLQGASVMASDLRASAALVLAGLVAKGETTIRRIYHLDRGYESLDTKLNSLGASIQRCPEIALKRKAA